MIQQNSAEEINPRDIEDAGTSSDRETPEDVSEESYDILPSNGPGLAGDDGEQVVDEEEIDEEED